MSALSNLRAPTDRGNGDAPCSGLILDPTHAVELSPIPLVSGRICIGAGADCDVRLSIRGISEQHCLIVAGPSKTIVKALSPKTWLNDGLVRETSLRSGDKLTIGPVEFRVREAFPSEMPAFDNARTTPPAVDPRATGRLWNEAAARRDLTSSAAAARRELELRSARPVASSGSIASAPTAQTRRTDDEDARLARQREYLAALAGSLTSREHELIAREADLRCRWEELQFNLARCRESEQAVSRQRDELSRREEDQNASRMHLESEQAGLRERISDVEAQQKALAGEAESLQSKRDEILQMEARLQQRELELKELEQTVAADRTRLEAERERCSRRSAELDRTTEQLSQERRALDAEKAAWQEEQRHHEAAGAEAHERLALQDQRQEQLQRKEQELSDDRAALEETLAALRESQLEFDRAQNELEGRVEELNRERAQLDAGREAMLRDREDLEAARAECAVLRASLENLARELADREVAGAQIVDGESDAVCAANAEAGDGPTPAAADAAARGGDEVHDELRQIALEREQLDAERERLATEQSRLDTAREQLLELRGSLDVDQLQSEWALLHQARRELEEEREILCRQLQEIAAVTSPQRADAEQVDVPQAAAADLRPECGLSTTEPPAVDLETAAIDHEDPGDDFTKTADDVQSAAEPASVSATLPMDWESLHAELTALADEDSENWVADSVKDGGFEQAPESPVLADHDEHECPHQADHAGLAGDLSDDGPPAPESEAIQSLRSRLAEMFGMTSHSEPVASREEDAAGTSPDALNEVHGDEWDSADPGDVARAVEFVHDELDDRDRFEERASLEIEPDTGDSAAAPVAEQDSISAYMERLLSRSRQGAAHARDAVVEAPAPTREPTAAAESPESDEEVSAAEDAPIASHKTLTAPDKELLRANLDSFRELANISARSAVAKHESKKLHSVMQFKLIMLAMAVGLTLALWAANLTSGGSYVPYAIAAGVAAVVMGAEAGRTLLAFYRWKSVEAVGSWEDEADAPGTAATPAAYVQTDAADESQPA